MLVYNRCARGQSFFAFARLRLVGKMIIFAPLRSVPFFADETYLILHYSFFYQKCKDSFNWLTIRFALFTIRPDALEKGRN